MDVLVLASGKSSRLKNYTHDYLPKYMLNIDRYCFLYYILNYWEKYSKRIFLVINSKFNQITQLYINNFLSELKDKIIIINYDTNDGTAYTLNYLFKNELKDYGIENLLISWCDIYPLEHIDFDKVINNGNKNNIFIFTCGDSCRYLYLNKKIIEYEHGNIIGIYYIQNFSDIEIIKDCKNKDIVEYLEDIGDLDEIKISNLLDYGDEKKYIKLLENNYISKEKFVCRNFNEMIVTDNKLIKRGINDKGKKIINYEKNFYRFINSIENINNLNLFPKIYTIYSHGYSMEYLKNYIPVYKILDKNKSKENELFIDKIINKLKLLHSLKKIKLEKFNFLNDVKIEIFEKIKNRIKMIDNIINYFPKFKKVNGLFIESFDKILKKCSEIIFYNYETINNFEYSIIHGDPNFSNILVDIDNYDNILFIDPRGYFGNSEIYGLPDYDYSKILYAISGYDKFNNEYFNIDYCDEHEITFNIPKIDVSKEFVNENFSKIHHIYVVIIWLGLAEYNKNNLIKCIISYYYGLYLGTLI